MIFVFKLYGNALILQIKIYKSLLNLKHFIYWIIIRALMWLSAPDQWFSDLIIAAPQFFFLWTHLDWCISTMKPVYIWTAKLFLVHLSSKEDSPCQGQRNTLEVVGQDRYQYVTWHLPLTRTLINEMVLQSQKTDSRIIRFLSFRSFTRLG